MRKIILRCAAFLCILALLLGGASWLFYPKDNRDIGQRQERLSTGLLAEKENTVDVLFLGDSLPMYAVSSIDIWGQFGVPCYTYATPQQDLVTTRRMLLNALHHQKPKVVVLETNALFREIPAQAALADWLYELVPAARYHDNWKKVPLRRMLAPVAYETEQESKGYYLTMRQSAPKNEAYLSREGEPEQLQPEALRLLRSIQKICQRENILLMLCSIPNAKSWSRSRSSLLSSVAWELGMTYLDLNLQDLGIDWSRDCMDHGDHMNYLGAQKVTAFLGSRLWDTELLTDKRSWPDYAHWNEQYMFFRALADKALAEGPVPQEQ